MSGEALLALAGSLVLAGSHGLTPAIARWSQRGVGRVESFSGGAGLAYVLLYLLFKLVKHGAAKIHALLPLWPEPLETLFLLLLAAVASNYLLQVQLAKSPSPRDDHLGFGVLFLVYNFLAGAGLLEEALAGPLKLGFYVVALALHLLANDLFLLHLDPGGHRWHWRAALAAMPFLGWAVAAGFALPEGVLYAMLAFVAGSTVINVVRHELPKPENFRSGAFASGVVVYTALIVVTWSV